MLYTVTAESDIPVNFAPETLAEEVLQNIRILLSTFIRSVMLDRRFGMDMRFIDKPVTVAETLFLSNVLDAIEKYEPRAKIQKVSFIQNEDEMKAGKIIPSAEVEIIEQEELS